MTIVGVGFDTPADNAAWAAEEGFSFELWSDDEDHTLAVYYGAAADARQGYPDRITRLLDEDGDVLLEYDDVATGTHPQKVLDDCLILFGATR